MKGIVTVPKESIGHTSFIKHEILPDTKSQQQRQRQLTRALTLGNAFHQKVRIVYQLQSGEYQQVETTVWAVEGDYVELKGGVEIPVHAIVDVEF